MMSDDTPQQIGKAKYFRVNGFAWKVFYQESSTHYVLEGGAELYVGISGEWILSNVLGTRPVTVEVLA